ncbi:MAG: energy transducer TonB [Pyrinomonadaceae bacterium]|nr:energy transducer TonB [Pyrinomonadaceae bacterium]
MKSNLIFCSFALVLAIFTIAAYSQITPNLRDSTPMRMPEEFIVQDVRGKIVNKPSYLPKPQYPSSAKISGIEGTVRVKIKVGLEGSVIEAKSFEGPVELYSVCEEAALKTRFVIARDSTNQPIQTEGHLTYTFEIKAANWIKIGYHLNFLQLFPITSAPLPTILKTIPNDWKEEFAQFKRLQTLQIEGFEKNPPPENSQLIGGSGVISPNSASVVGQFRVPIPPRPSAEQISIVQNLIPALQNRLKDDELNFWKFKVGLGIGKALVISRNPVTQNDAVAIIRDLQTSAPKDVSTKVLEELENLSQLLQKRTERDGINQALIYILSSK